MNELRCKCENCGNIYMLKNKIERQYCPNCNAKANIKRVTDHIKNENTRYCLIYGCNNNILRKL